MSQKPIFALEDLTKTHGRKTILKDVNLAFLENAKIGVIGLNGAGKSTLLRLMAGEDKEYDGVIRPREGLTVGHVPQEPKLAEGKTVLENVEIAVAPIRALLKRHDELNERLAEDMSPEEM
ncbi:MAG: ATP-binding cassette domain-containing protein, partial [Planctomycetota bacterium]